MTAPTAKRRRFVAALFVDLAPRVREIASPVLGTLGFNILNVGHPAAAGERLPISMPCLVLAHADLDAGSREMLADRCVAVGATLLLLPRDGTEADVKAKVALAGAEAYERSRKNDE